MFDGKIVHSFESILADNTTLINNSIFNIIELNNKELLFISKDGISVFNRDLFNFKRVKIPVPISILADDINGKIFITTSYSGIYVLDFEFNILKNYKSDPLNLFQFQQTLLKEETDKSQLK